MRRLKIGIRPQLIILVCFSSLFSLLILAVVTGVYFSTSLSNTRAERLEVIAQLKTSQVKQSVEFIFYQVYFLSTKESLYTPLISNKAGNSSISIFSGAQSTLESFLQSSELFAAARLYNLNLDIMADSYNNQTNISAPCMDYLYPLQQNSSIPAGLVSSSSAGYSTYFTGPASNTSDPMSPYFMGLTIPVYANTSIIFTSPSIAGYLTVIASASNIQQAVNDSTSGNDYEVIVVRPYYSDDTSASSSNRSSLVGFETVFPAKDSFAPGYVYDIESSPMVRTAFSKDSGVNTKVQSLGRTYAIGYTQIQIDQNTYWSVIIEQTRGVFMAPINKLRDIIIGVVIGIGVFVCLVTFPLAVWFIRPITKLKEATEAITRSKKRTLQSERSPTPSSSHPPPYGVSSSLMSHVGRISTSSPPPTGGGGLIKRNSVHSSNSLYSYGIRLPGKIPSSKKFFKDGFTELSDAFNIMTEELDKQYTHLEDRVKVRTKELEISKIEAESANEAKTVFIANISHELRTPLNGILGMTSIAMEEQDTTRILDSLKLIHRSGELLLHILTELLTYSKNTLNRSKLEKSNFRILEIVYQVQSIFSKLAIDQRVNLRISLKPNAIRKLILYGDSNRIIQIVMNLVSNSLKFTPVDGSVDVSFKLLGEYDYGRSKEGGFKKVYVVEESSQEDSREDSQEYSREDSREDSRREAFKGDFEASRGSERKFEASRGSERNFGPSGGSDRKFEPSRGSDGKSEPSRGSDGKSEPFGDSETKFEPSRPSETFQEVSQRKIKPSGGSESSRDISKNSTTQGSSRNISGGSTTHRVTRDGSTSSTGNSHPKNYHSGNGSNGISNGEAPKSTNGVSKASRSEAPLREASSKAYTLVESPFNDTFSDQSSIKTMSSNEYNEKIYPSFVREDKQLPTLPEEVLDQSGQLSTNGGTTASIAAAANVSVDSPNIAATAAANAAATATATANAAATGTASFGNYKLQRLAKSKSWVIQIQVIDTGPGIEPALQEKVFEPFIQGDQTLSRSYGGTGLGLSICRQLATMMKGTLTLKSEIGVGSIFTFTVPLPQTHQISVPEEDMKQFCEDEFNPESRMNRKVAFKIDEENPNQDPEPASSSSLSPDKLKLEVPQFEKPHLITRGSTGTANSAGYGSDSGGSSQEATLERLSDLKILVAEDNLVNQEVIKRMLKLEGFSNISMACNGQEAIDQLAESIDNGNVFDLVFMDIQMPKVDGLLATKRIRANLGYTNPIIALTAFADESNVRECLNSGMSGFLSKPIKRSNLKKIIVEFSQSIQNEKNGAGPVSGPAA
ncbi:histidine protein kinase Sln1p [[Candida] anglica]